MEVPKLVEEVSHEVSLMKEELERIRRKTIKLSEDIKKAVDQLEQLVKQKKEELTRDEAIRAWLEARKAVRDYGPYRSVEFDDPAIRHAINSLGGWAQFCVMPSDVPGEAASFQEQFIAAYTAWRPGMEEGELRGFHGCKPVYISTKTSV
jgi:hypothetical protein